MRLSAATAPPCSLKAPPAAPHRLSGSPPGGIWHNLGEAAEKGVHRHRGFLRPNPEPPDDQPQGDAESTASSPWPTGHRFADPTRAKHATVHAPLAAGHSKRSVARQVGMTLNTIFKRRRSHGKAPCHPACAVELAATCD